MEQVRKPRKRRKALPRPLEITTHDGITMTLNDPASLFGDALKATEKDAIRALEDLIDMDLKECDGKNEMAKVSAAMRVLDLLSDKETPKAMMEKLEPLRHPAVDALQDVAINGAVASARTNAGAYLLKAIRAAAPSVWPPDTTRPDWQDRMEKANKVCALNP